MNTVQIKFYDLLKKDLHLSDDKAAVFVEALGNVVEFEMKNEKGIIATREDIHQLNGKIENLSSTTREDIHQLNGKIENLSSTTREDIHRLEIKLEQSKVDIYKAMFWTGIVQLLAILGGVLAIVKFVS